MVNRKKVIIGVLAAVIVIAAAIMILSSLGLLPSFGGNDGEVATIKLNVASNVPIGSYPIVLRNISISDSGANSYDVTLVKSTMTVTSNVLGDVNGDGYLTMADVSALVDFIMGKNPSPFDKKLADVNKDGDINVADVTELLKVFNTEYFH